MTNLGGVMNCLVPIAPLSIFSMIRSRPNYSVVTCFAYRDFNHPFFNKFAADQTVGFRELFYVS